ncbi:MAG: hypothetical protein GC192_09435 [Bacteroidetes bacterium]|nr:hypothetical protein [Bacteroidota bacterium]
MKYARIIFFFLLSAVATSAFAQPGLPGQEVEVVKIFEAQLAESAKVAVLPELPPVDTSVSKQTYEVTPKNIEVDYPAPRIRPVTYKSDEEIADVYNGYIKLGAGLPKSIYGDASYNKLVELADKSKLDIGINAFHHQADYSSGDIENQRFGLTKVAGKGTYYNNKGYAVAGNLGYTSNRVSYYGYTFDRFDNHENIDKEAVKQVFGIFDMGAKIFNGVQTAGDINYSAGFDFYHMGDDFAANENGFDLKLNATKWIRGKHSFDIGLRTDFTNFKVNGQEQKLNNFWLTPSFTFHGSAIKIKAGANLISNNDEYLPFPDVEVVVNLTGNELAFYTGLEGGFEKNTFRSIATYNPYINTQFPDGTLRNTKYFNFYAGLKGNFKMFEYMIQGGYKPTNDLAVYLFRHEFNGTEPDLIHDFEVHYADANIINVRASLKANILKNLAFTGVLSQNFYDVSIERKPWHLPALDANFMAIYTTSDNKLRAKAQLNLSDGVTANTLGGVNRWTTLNGLYDVSLGAEYWFVKKFGAFLEVNNLLNNKRERWIYYPTYGINVLAGITARF